MNRQQSILAARGVTDRDDRLLSADEPLAQLHQSCGGSLPGTLAIPELLDLVRQARKMGLKIARDFSAFDGQELVGGFARIHPLSEKEGAGCEVLIEGWQRAPLGAENASDHTKLIDAVDRVAAEATARLDARQHIQFLSTRAADLAELAATYEANPGKAWSEYIELAGIAHHQPLHWRLLDGAQAQLPGSERNWRVRLIPIGTAGGAPRGFELLLIADEPLHSLPGDVPQEVAETPPTRLVGQALTPVLRQPIARIIANAETIRARLAGPLRDEYSDYAGNIATAGQHLAGMLDDLADLEVVEAPDFSTAREKVDLADVARRAAGILGVRAHARSITVILPEPKKPAIAIAEFRRVLQILINLIGNAIAYSPEGSTVTLRCGFKPKKHKVWVSVSDEGPGISPEQAARVFEKFERLGRDSDGGNDTGSGLGLYISRRLALAMDGELEVVDPDARERAGAEFKLILPRA